jgi:hypothetical protein
MSENRYWFAPKRYGYGAGLPIAWQGWVAMVVHLALIGGLTIWLNEAILKLMIALMFAAFLPLPLYAAKTRGGWKWRDGSRD